MSDYVPPMPRTGTPPTEDSETAKPTEKSPPFPRATEKEKAEFAKGFGGKERKEAAPKKRPRTASGRLEEKLEDLFSTIALPFAIAGDMHCANIVAQGAPKMATAWVALADENPGVKRVLTKLTEGSAWGGVIVATASVALPIAAHHGAPVPAILGGSSSTPKPSQPPTRAASVPTADASSMGAPVAVKDPIAYATGEDGFIPAPVEPGAPPGVVTVGARNLAAANGANGLAAYQ